MQEDIYNRKKDYAAEVRRLEKAILSPRNKEIIETFHKHLLSEGASHGRIIKLSAQLREIGSLLGKDFDTTNEADIRRVVADIHGTTRSPETKGDYRRIIKQFYKWLEGKGKTYPEKVEWIKTEVKVNGKENIDIISSGEVEKVIKGCDNDRDRAFISLLYEGGFRIAEILGMRIRDFKNQQHYGKVSVTGKTGPRAVLIVNSLPYLNKYLDVHPNRENLDKHMWICNGSYRHNERLMYVGASRLVKRAFKQANIQKKRLYLHLFRHSRATELASHLTEAQMKQYFGWVKASDTPSVYIHLSGRDVDKAILAYNGIESEEKEQDKISKKNIECDRCNTINVPQGKFCMRCGLALDTKTAMETEEKIKDETNKTLKLLMEIMEDPKLKREFEKFKKKMESEK